MGPAQDWLGLSDEECVWEETEQTSAVPDGSSAIAFWHLLFHRFTYTTYLDLTSHRFVACLSTQPVEMPELITMRILPTSLSKFVFCHRSQSVPSRTCPLIANLRPRRLILGDTHTSLRDMGDGL
jgi:hypothetical protein